MANELTGAQQLSRQLQKMGAEMGGKALRSAAMSSMLPVLKTAISNAPINDRDYKKVSHKGNPLFPGYLKRNIARKGILSRDKRFVRVMVGPKPEAFYGTAFVELGTSKIPAQPWLEPALRSNKDLVVKKLRERLKKIIEKATRKK